MPEQNTQQYKHVQLYMVRAKTDIYLIQRSLEQTTSQEPSK